ncbi:nucleolar protein dao-5-like isoform X2 [Oryza brachyantha]|uniref:nucleolar protein dao-5-like isoform X2 n=1 Tax=Oryza brachyantha TaxID=4533 RepID=UPI001ADADBD7|nr:nucleolar protein dao-5-like isoform X2 [Oryza brachyantha]
MEGAATAMDFHALSRRELQALCKRNGVRANMTNAAMADALQLLPLVDGIDEIGTTLCLPTPGRSTMKSALKAAAAIGEEEDQQQQHGSPLPRGRRVSVKSPEAIRMDVEEGEDEMKRDLGREIMRTPGVALRSTSRRARATPAPIPPTPAASSVRATTRRTTATRKTEEAAPTPATLRRSQRTAARKASAPMEEEVTTTKTTARRSARSKVMIDIEQEVEDMAMALKEVKVQEEDPKDAASNEKCDETEVAEATKLMEEGSGKEEESEEGEEVSDKSCDDPKEEMVATGEESAKTQEVEGVGKEQELTSVVNSAHMPTMEDSPILGVLSKPERVEPLSEKVEHASVGDCPRIGELSAVNEITGEMSDKEVDADEVPEEKLSTDIAGDKTGSEEDGLNARKEASAVEMPQADLTGDETSEEEDLNVVKEGAVDVELQADLKDAETSEDVDIDEYAATEASSEETDGESDPSEVDTDSEEEEAEMPPVTVEDALITEINHAGEEEDEASSEETDGESDPSELATDSEEEEAEMLPVTVEDALITEINHAGEEEDDFSDDLPPEFDSAGNFTDAETETESDSTAVTSSAAKAAAVKHLDDESSVTESSSEEEVSQQEIEASLKTIVKSLDVFTITQQDELAEEMKSIDVAEAAGAKELKKNNNLVEDLKGKSLRKLKSMYKDSLIAKAATEGKRLALAELDDNAGVGC